MAGDNNWNSDSDSSYVILSDVASVGSDSENFVIVAKDNYLSTLTDDVLPDERRHRLNETIFAREIIETNPRLRVSILYTRLGLQGCVLLLFGLLESTAYHFLKLRVGSQQLNSVLVNCLFTH
ncbi:hypothetical protein M0R45_038081 [Rubus argutus]|uniref:Uncharacterized protein n=1 Tax=Rubus argutus TaxID=59490 RepID=A0AAW1W279_RUBAR